MEGLGKEDQKEHDGVQPEKKIETVGKSWLVRLHVAEHRCQYANAQEYRILQEENMKRVVYTCKFNLEVENFLDVLRFQGMEPPWEWGGIFEPAPSGTTTGSRI